MVLLLRESKNRKQKLAWAKDKVFLRYTEGIKRYSTKTGTVRITKMLDLRDRDERTRLRKSDIREVQRNSTEKERKEAVRVE